MKFIYRFMTVISHLRFVYGIMCTVGQFYNETSMSCQACPDNEFMHEETHENRQCRRCSRPNQYDGLEIIHSACNSTHDAVLACKPGLYRTPYDCEFCTDCSFIGKYEARKCDLFADTVYCDEEGMIVTGEDPQCVRQPTTTTTSPTEAPRLICQENHFLERSTANFTARCSPCPEGTHLNVTNHTRETCNNFSEPLTPSCDCLTVGKAGDDCLVSIVVAIIVCVCVFLIVLLILYIIFRRRYRCEKKTRSTSQPEKLEETKELNSLT